MIKQTQNEARKSKAREHVLVIAEHGADISARLLDLDRAGARVHLVVQDHSEDTRDFMRRLSHELASGDCVYQRTFFVAREPIGPRLNEFIRTIVCSMRPGARLILAAEFDTPYARRALSALALTVMEMMTGSADVTVEGAPLRESVPTRAWRRRIDRALDGLLAVPVGIRRAGVVN